jgi:nicotinamidase-related amidase
MRIELEKTCAVLIDVQERLFPHMHERDALASRIATFLGGVGTLGVPLVATEQYPKGLGPTLPEVAESIDGFAPVVKSAFSCCDEPTFADALDVLGRPIVLVAGIEAHVCVLQTVIDLLERNYTPVLVADATSSRSAFDRDIALRRAESEGARITTVESILFELTRYSGTPRFKEISRLVK